MRVPRAHARKGEQQRGSGEVQQTAPASRPAGSRKPRGRSGRVDFGSQAGEIGKAAGRSDPGGRE
eukprot:10084738-Alexandrium_andersonii.AAC.1